jgi:hypothetical protein
MMNKVKRQRTRIATTMKTLGETRVLYSTVESNCKILFDDESTKNVIRNLRVDKPVLRLYIYTYASNIKPPTDNIHVI